MTHVAPGASATATPFLPQEFIRLVRDRARDGKIPHEGIEAFIRGVANKSVSEGQIAAFCMAVYLNGLDAPAKAALTRAMAYSGRVMKHDVPGPVIDKHSTGGVGDKVSLMLAPIVASAGVYVPMISGRGLGHTGGTLDKMQTIPGYNALPDDKLFADVVKHIGCAIIGQTGELAPADQRIYAVRDVTATVESIDLITASILSKKIEAGLNGLVMDVKFGSGAFMSRIEDARALAESIVEVAGEAGLPTTALLTDMNDILGFTAGNAIEVIESIEFLNGTAREPRLLEVTLDLAAAMIALGLGVSEKEARATAEKKLADGSAAERFAAMVRALGGPADLMEKPQKYLAKAPLSKPVFAARDGVVSRVDIRQVGLAIVALGGGRTHPDQKILPDVGLSDVAYCGTLVEAGRTPLATIHARDEAQWQAAAAMLQAAYTVGEDVPAARPLVAERIGRMAR